MLIATKQMPVATKPDYVTEVHAVCGSAVRPARARTAAFQHLCHCEGAWRPPSMLCYVHKHTCTRLHEHALVFIHWHARMPWLSGSALDADPACCTNGPCLLLMSCASCSCKPAATPTCQSMIAHAGTHCACVLRCMCCTRAYVFVLFFQF